MNHRRVVTRAYAILGSVLLYGGIGGLAGLLAIAALVYLWPWPLLPPPPDASTPIMAAFFIDLWRGVGDVFVELARAVAVFAAMSLGGFAAFGLLLFKTARGLDTRAGWARVVAGLVAGVLVAFGTITLFVPDRSVLVLGIPMLVVGAYAIWVLGWRFADKSDASPPRAAA